MPSAHRNQHFRSKKFPHRPAPKSDPSPGASHSRRPPPTDHTNSRPAKRPRQDREPRFTEQQQSSSFHGLAPRKQHHHKFKKEPRFRRQRSPSFEPTPSPSFEFEVEDDEVEEWEPEPDLISGPRVEELTSPSPPPSPAMRQPEATSNGDCESKPESKPDSELHTESENAPGQLILHPLSHQQTPRSLQIKFRRTVTWDTSSAYFQSQQQNQQLNIPDVPEERTVIETIPLPLNPQTSRPDTLATAKFLGRLIGECQRGLYDAMCELAHEAGYPADCVQHKRLSARWFVVTGQRFEDVKELGRVEKPAKSRVRPGFLDAVPIVEAFLTYGHLAGREDVAAPFWLELEYVYEIGAPAPRKGREHRDGARGRRKGRGGYYENVEFYVDDDPDEMTVIDDFGFPLIDDFFPAWF